MEVKTDHGNDELFVSIEGCTVKEVATAVAMLVERGVEEADISFETESSYGNDYYAVVRGMQKYVKERKQREILMRKAAEQENQMERKSGGITVTGNLRYPTSEVDNG